MKLAVLQARMSSSRLPGKVLLPVCGQPMLARQIERIKRARQIDRLVIATSNNSEDKVIADLAESLGVSCFRGNLDDVLDRYYQASLPYRPEHVIRLTGDNPLCDPDVIDYVIKEHVEGGTDYTSNDLEPTFPNGLQVEVIKFTALKDAWEKATTRTEREHVTYYIYQHAERFTLKSLKRSPALSKFRWTVDYKEDYKVISEIYSRLYPQNSQFSTDMILDLYQRTPSLADINAHIKRNEGLGISLKKEFLIDT